MGHEEQGAERDQPDPPTLFPLPKDLAQEDDGRETGGKAGGFGAPRPGTTVSMGLKVPAYRQPHGGDRQEDSDAVERDGVGRLTPDQEHDHDGGDEGEGHRACEGPVTIAVDDDLGDLADGHVPPLRRLRVLEGGHRSGRQQSTARIWYAQNSTSPPGIWPKPMNARLPTSVRPSVPSKTWKRKEKKVRKNVVTPP